MAKVQGKKTAAGSARRATGKVAARIKSAARAIKNRVTAKPAASAAKKPSKPARPSKPAAKRAAKPAPKPTAKAKAAPKPAPKPKKELKPAKPLKKAAAAPPSRPVAVPPAAPKTPAAPRAAAAAPETKKRTRRPRPRVHSNGAPVANWLPPGAEKPRPSSFIPAPARAEAPSLVAAPPASSDRLIRAEDVTEFVTRTVPIRVDIEQAAGRFYVHVNPDEVTLRPGEGIEWDFRYLGGADINVDELVIEFEKPAPFSHVSFRSRKPGGARPHRQLSGPVQKSAAGKRVRYVIRAFNQFKTELASFKPGLNVVA